MVRGAAVTSGVPQGNASRLPEDALRGFALFNRGEFYACHERLEDAWREEPGRVRYLYQGVLQVGVGFYHLRRGNLPGARSLVRKGLSRLREFEPETRGVDVERLVREVELLCSELLYGDHLSNFLARNPTLVPEEFPKVRGVSGAEMPPS